MTPRNSPSGPLQEAFQGRLFRFNPMEAYAVPPTILSIRKNADQSAMARIVCCTRPASAIAADASGVPSVKQGPRSCSHAWRLASICTSIPSCGVALASASMQAPLVWP